MSDTLELVEWSLEHSCPLRREHFPKVISRHALTLYRAQWVGKSPQRLFEGIYISGYSPEQVPGEKRGVDYPQAGFVAAEIFREHGGLAGVERACGSCPANIYPSGLAGCFGSIYQAPDHQLVEEQLRRIILRLGLQSEVSRQFPSIKPLWRGLWAHSPLSLDRIRLLKLILTEMMAEDRTNPGVRPQQLVDFQNLLDAMELSETQGFALHVNLLPLGHTDDGIYTVFPHCPLCKAIAQAERFLPNYPDILQNCRICQTSFSPRDTAAAYRDKCDDLDLRKQLSQAEFERLARAYLVAQGERGQVVDAIIDRVETEERDRQAALLRDRERAQRESNYLREHVYFNLVQLPLPFDGCDEPEVAPRDSEWLSGDDLLIALHRAQNLGLRVTGLIHRSDFEVAHNRYQFKLDSDPNALLAHWRAEGCREKFVAFFSIPEALLYPELPTEELEKRQAQLDAPRGGDSDENFFKWLSE